MLHSAYASRRSTPACVFSQAIAVRTQLGSATSSESANDITIQLGVHTSVVRKYGLDDEGILELMAVVDLFSGYNKLMDRLQVEPDEKPWYG